LTAAEWSGIEASYKPTPNLSEPNLPGLTLLFMKDRTCIWNAKMENATLKNESVSQLFEDLPRLVFFAAVPKNREF